MYFAIFSAWSGQPVIANWLLAMYNTLFTALPPLALALFDRPASADVMLAHASIYNLSQDRSSFLPSTFFSWIVLALAHSAMLFFLSMGICNKSAFLQSSRLALLILRNCAMLAEPFRISQN